MTDSDIVKNVIPQTNNAIAQQQSILSVIDPYSSNSSHTEENKIAEV